MTFICFPSFKEEELQNQMQENRVWIREVIGQTEKMAIIPHYSLSKTNIRHEVVFLVRETTELTIKVISKFLSSKSAKTNKFLSNGFTVMQYNDGGVAQTSFITRDQLLIESKQEMGGVTVPPTQDNMDFKDIIRLVNKSQIKHKHIIHISPTFTSNKRPITEDETKVFVESSNEYSLVVMTQKNERVVGEMKEIRIHPMFKRCEAGSPLSCVVWEKETAYEIEPFQGTLKGVFVKIPDIYVMGEKSWEMHERPPFYIVSNGEIEMTQESKVFETNIISKCYCKGVEGGVIKERRKEHGNSILWGVNCIEKQMIAKEVCKRQPKKQFNVLGQRLFIETDERMEAAGRRMDITELMELRHRRVGIIEKEVAGLEAMKGKEFEAMQHWSYFYTAKRMVITAAQSSKESSIYLEHENMNEIVSCVHLAHESVSKFYFANEGGPNEIKQFLMAHRECNELCKSFLI